MDMCSDMSQDVSLFRCSLQHVFVLNRSTMHTAMPIYIYIGIADRMCSVRVWATTDENTTAHCAVPHA